MDAVSLSVKSAVLWVMSGFCEPVSEVSRVRGVMSGCREPVSIVSCVILVIS